MLNLLLIKTWAAERKQYQITATCNRFKRSWPQPYSD